MNNKILEKITLGLYVLTTKDGGCIVDAVSQISAGDNPLIAVSVNKNNYTNTLLKNNKRFALSVLKKDVNPDIIKTFGFNSSKDIDKFANIDTTIVNDLNVINDSLGYMICDVEDMIENETHTLFIGRFVMGNVLNDGDTLSYNYYREHKEELLQVKTDSKKTAWICTICGYVYYGDELPIDFTCPICGVDSSLFKIKE